MAWHRDKWVPVTTAWRVLRLWMEERPADMEGSCEHIEQADVDSRQGVVLLRECWTRCLELLTIKKLIILRKSDLTHMEAK
jgi:hypothetical protein